ncbi:MAG: hypothetical protein QXT79_10600 [Thermofilaceae archaeon]
MENTEGGMGIMKLILLDTSVIKSIIEKNIAPDKFIRDLINEIEKNKNLNLLRYKVIIFKDELQRKVLEKVIEELKITRYIIYSFSIKVEAYSYSGKKSSFYRECGENVVRMIRRFFGIGPDENCDKEIENDAFLLIVACAKAKGMGYEEIVLVTRDIVACCNSKRALKELQLCSKVRVLLKRDGDCT